MPHKGIALAFRRTYNSQSSHDVNGSDGAVASLYGNGWTNTFDAHLAWNLNAPTPYVSVNDIDGARYDYTLSADKTQWLPPAGQHATLTYDGSCGFYWGKKTGTIYYFWLPDLTYSGCNRADVAAYGGRLYQIIGRNHNNTITFTYSWDGGIATAGGKVSNIVAATESGLTATLHMADVNGHRILYTLTRPDGVKISYNYDNAGDLSAAFLPTNSTVGTIPEEVYGYTAGANGVNKSSSVLQWASSPRWIATTHKDGGYDRFTFVGSGLSQIDHIAYVDPTPSDGTNTLLQPLPANGSGNASSPYSSEHYALGALGSASTPTLRDTDGHMTNWVADPLGRPTQTQECTQSTNQGQQCTGLWLVTNTSWDSANNLIAVIDPRGNETDYAFDAIGNTIAVGEPAPFSGAFRPTSLYSYDTSNNVTAYCDPVATHSLNADWTAPPSPPPSQSLCPQTSIARRFQWQALSYEPFGELQAITSPGTSATPNGYTTSLTYDASRQGGQDFGLPTQVVGVPFAQLDGSQRQPRQDFWYDSSGNLACYNKGTNYWVLSYDAVNRVVKVADPDDASSNPGSVCAKAVNSPSMSGWNTTSTTVYYPNGAVSATQSPSQRAANVLTSFTYDLDGDEASETHHYGCASQPCSDALTTKWYDGAGRLVEVILPHDTSDFYPFAFMTRYIYDLSGGSRLLSIGNIGNVAAYGNLYKTQEYLGPQIVSSASPPSTGSWQDLRGNAFDSLDRSLTKYDIGMNAAAPISTDTYDGANQLGLLSMTTNAAGQSSGFLHDADGRISAVQNSGTPSTPNRDFSYDADGRATVKTIEGFGTETVRYDAVGNIVEDDEPNGAGFTSPAVLTYGFYQDGSKASVSVASAALSQQLLLQYSYRADGIRSRTHVNSSWQTGDFAWSYSDAGRPTAASDPLTGSPLSNGSNSATTFLPKTASYDTTGQLSAFQLPSGDNYATFTHDPEGETQRYVRGWGYPSTNGSPLYLGVDMAYNVRGEQRSTQFEGAVCGKYAQFPSANMSNTYSASANGYMVPTHLCAAPPKAGWGTDSFNALDTVRPRASIRSSFRTAAIPFTLTYRQRRTIRPGVWRRNRRPSPTSTRRTTRTTAAVRCSTRTTQRTTSSDSSTTATRLTSMLFSIRTTTSVASGRQPGRQAMSGDRTSTQLRWERCLFTGTAPCRCSRPIRAGNC